MKQVYAMLIISLLLSAKAEAQLTSRRENLTPEQRIEGQLNSRVGGEGELNNIGKTAALPALHKLLIKYVNDEVKGPLVVGMILSFHDESSVDPLMQAWKQNQKLESDIIPAILKIYDENNKSDKAYQAMIMLLKAPRFDYGEELGLNERLRNNLIKYADASKVNYLISFLDGPQYLFSPEDVMKRLSEIGVPKVVVPVIARFLEDPHPSRRSSASEMLGDIKSELAIAPLKKALKVEKDIGAKIHMAAQLVKLGEFNYLDEIIKVLEDTSEPIIHDQKVKSIATSWLKDATGQDFNGNARAWRSWFEQEKVKRGLK